MLMSCEDHFCSSHLADLRVYRKTQSYYSLRFVVGVKRTYNVVLD